MARVTDCDKAGHFLKVVVAKRVDYRQVLCLLETVLKAGRLPDDRLQLPGL